MAKERFNRQLLLFGDAGQERIEKTSVAIVGVGGVGSHVVQQLAYLGIRKFVLVDKDIVSETNLNRLIGAKLEDIGVQKVQVMRRLIHEISPDAIIEAVSESVVSYTAFNLLKKADFIFGCVDMDAVRLVLTEFCSAYSKPYMDIATDIHVEEKLFGGRILFSVDGERCLFCKGELNQDSINSDLSSDGQKQENLDVYGLPAEVLKRTGPAVVSLNGILASVAVTEFMAYITKLRQVFGHLEYKGHMGKLLVNTDYPQSGCWYCKEILGRGSLVDVERHIRENKIYR